MVKKAGVRNRLLTYISISALWIMVALFLSVVSFLMARQGEIDYSLGIAQSILFEIICISPWIFCTPAIVWMARNYKVGTGQTVKSLWFHLVAALLVFGIHSLVQSSAVFYFFDEPFSWNYVKVDFVGFADMRILLYIGVLLGVQTIDFYRKNQRSILKEPRIKAELNKAHFQKILNHLQPEFLIKSIDAIKRDVVEEHPQQAEKHLNKLAGLLRMMLNNINKEEVAFSEDMNFLDRYLDLTERRLGITIERINEIDPRCLGALIPNFLFIMPLLEELLQSRYSDISRISHFTNKAWLEGETLHLEGVIGQVNVTEAQLARIADRVKLDEIQDRLHDKYGDALQLNSYSQDGEVHIYMSMPYKQARQTQNEVHHTAGGYE